MTTDYTMTLAYQI